MSHEECQLNFKAAPPSSTVTDTKGLAKGTIHMLPREMKSQHFKIKSLLVSNLKTHYLSIGGQDKTHFFPLYKSILIKENFKKKKDESIGQEKGRVENHGHEMYHSNTAPSNILIHFFQVPTP